MSDFVSPLDRPRTLLDILPPDELEPILRFLAGLVGAPLYLLDDEGRILYANSVEQYVPCLPVFARWNNDLPASAASYSLDDGCKALIAPLNLPDGIPVGLCGVVRDQDLALVAPRLWSAGKLFEVISSQAWQRAISNEMHLAAMGTTHLELSEQNERLQAMLERVKALDRTKFTFMQTVSHELKTPLTSICGYAEILKEEMAGPITAEQREYADTILRKGELLLDMITSVLDITRLGAGKGDLNLAEGDVAEALLPVIRAFENQAALRQISIQTTVAPAAGRTAMDAFRIGRAVSALLSNAVKFSANGQTIEVEIGRERRRALAGTVGPFDPVEEEILAIRVVDHGIGIPASEHRKIFDSFYQIDSSTTREYGGAGLGLTLARNFVEAHGGRITVDSQLGEGSTFTITFPTSLSVPRTLDGNG